jgi:phosphoadenosine phosphosulfate reductase
MIKHFTKGGRGMTLIDYQLFETVDKVDRSIKRIQKHEPPEGYYVAFSGGKDSIVLLDLVKRSGVKHDAHMSLTSVDPPELLKFIKKNYPDVELMKPPKTMFQLILHKMTPPRMNARFCCELLKERGGEGRLVATGIRWEESSRRKLRKVKEVSINKKKIFLHPIIDWASDEIWDYIKGKNLPYCSLYDEGIHRIGCIGCPSGNRRKDFARWPRYEKAYRNTFIKLIEQRKARGLSITGNYKDVDSMFTWWLQESGKESDTGSLFE